VDIVPFEHNYLQNFKRSDETTYKYN
jgi:hypothetical protein